ncbi:hypothetical protein ACIXOK_13390 [Bacteroides fragilis]
MALKLTGGRWKMRVEDKQAENAIFHCVITLIINGVSGKGGRWKIETYFL